MAPTIVEGKRFVDTRGYLSFINDLDLTKYKRFYTVENHRQGFIRAWHGHKKESKAVVCLRGAAKIAIINMEESEGISCYERPIPTTFIIDASNPKAVIIPAGYANGAMNLTSDCIIMYYSDVTIEEAKDDDFRFDWQHWDTKIWDSEYK